MTDPVVEAPDKDPEISQINRGKGKIHYIEMRSRKIRKLDLA